MLTKCKFVILMKYLQMKKKLLSLKILKTTKENCSLAHSLFDLTHNFVLLSKAIFVIVT